MTIKIEETRVPRDSKEMVALNLRWIEGQLGRLNNRPAVAEDLRQSVLLNLVQTDVVGKFWLMAEKKGLGTVTVGHWRGYLSRAVANHFLNFCRSSRRRHKERPTRAADLADQLSYSQMGDADVFAMMSNGELCTAPRVHEVEGLDLVAAQRAVMITTLGQEKYDALMAELATATNFREACRKVGFTTKERELLKARLRRVVYSFDTGAGV